MVTAGRGHVGWLLEWGSREIWALRMVRRDSHQSLGEHLGASEQTVRRWEKGGQPPTHKELLRKLDETLAALEPWRREWFDELRAQLPAPTVDAAANGSTGEEDEADRRQASKTMVVGGLAATAVPLDALERITTHGDRPVDSKLITAHEDIADTLARLHYTLRSDALVGLVGRHADVLLSLLERPMAVRDRRRLNAVSVGSCGQAGMLYFNLADRLAARRYFALARDVADDAGDDTLRAQASGVASALYSPLPTGGQHGHTRRAVALLQESVDHDGTLAWVRWWLATELAAAGDERGFRLAAEAGERLPGCSSQQDRRGFFGRFVVGPGEISANTGAGLVLLGHADEAIDALRDGLALPWPRVRVMLRGHTAAAHVLQSEPEQACQALERARDLAADAGYLMGIQRIRGVRARFPATWISLPCVQELDERLRLTHGWGNVGSRLVG